MKIFNAKQIREIDSYTIENEPIASIDLMERASKACFNFIKKIISKKDKIIVLCGMGNNGGDGLAISRMLLLSGYNVTVCKVVHRESGSDDFQTNEERFLKIRNTDIVNIHNEADIPDLQQYNVIIDALIGSGLNSLLKGLLGKVVAVVNASKCLVISLDIPSGLFCDDNSENDSESIISANYTLTFQSPKLSFLFPENDYYTGNWVVLDIGLSREYMDKIDTDFYYVHKEDIKPLYKPRKKFAHKGHYGHALLLAGSKGKCGAAILAADSAVKTGLGLLTVGLPKCCNVPVQVSVPEAMVLMDDNNDYLTELKDLSKFTVAGIGPGIGVEKQTQNVLKLLIQNSSQALVIDADAINIIAENPTWLSFLPKYSVLTPHPGEFDRLAGKCSGGFDRLQKAREISFKHGIYIILKGAYTAIVCPDKKVFFNSTGNPGMATGGSGDVLTGMVLSLLAQGYMPRESALVGVYIHGLAGDLHLRRDSMESLTAGDIIKNIGSAIKKVFY